MGFTLTELLVAALIGMMTSSVAGQALVSHLKSSEKAEAMERQRNDWARTTSFIEAEIALSERLIDNSDNILFPSACPVTPSEFRLAIDMRRDLPLVIYAVKPSTSSWLPDNMLWRCGPSLNENGSYKSELNWSPILDGLDGNSDDGGFSINQNEVLASEGKHLSFTLALKGHSTVRYGTATGARTRISPLYSKPSDGSLCEASNLVNVAGKAGEPDNISVPLSQIKSGEDVLICGYGGGDTITGSEANDIIEAGDIGTSYLYGKAGNDFIRGTTQTDYLYGEEGNDVLVGREGDDELNGGDGQNTYLPGTGEDTINGGSDLDIVFFEGPRSDFTTDGCSKALCDVIDKRTNETNDLTGVEILIFNNARLDLPGQGG